MTLTMHGDEARRRRHYLCASSPFSSRMPEDNREVVLPDFCPAFCLDADAYGVSFAARRTAADFMRSARVAEILYFTPR